MANKNPDWDRIEIEYRANKLSIREIARIHEVGEATIRKRAKKNGWQRDLAKKVQARTEEKLVRNAAHELSVKDEEVVEEIAGRNATVVETHRIDIRAGRDITSMLMTELHDNTKHIESLEGLIAQASEDEEWSDKRRATVNRAVSLPQRAAVMRDLATSMKTLQGLERTAFGIDGKETDEMSYEERLNALLEDSE